MWHRGQLTACSARVPCGISTNPACSLLMAREGGRGWPKFPGSCTHTGDQKLLVPGFPDPVLAVRAIWGVNQRMADLSLSNSFR